MLNNLIKQILYVPEPKKITLRDPLCPKCKIRARSIAVVSGKIADYCVECKRESYQKNKAKKELK